MNKQLESDLNELCSSCTLFSELSESSVFVTGSTGLIGSLFIKALLTFNQKNNSNIKVIDCYDINEIDSNLSKNDNILIMQTCSNNQEYKNYAKKYLLVISKRIDNN